MTILNTKIFELERKDFLLYLLWIFFPLIIFIPFLVWMSLQNMGAAAMGAGIFVVVLMLAILPIISIALLFKVLSCLLGKFSISRTIKYLLMGLLSQIIIGALFFLFGTIQATGDAGSSIGLALIFVPCIAFELVFSITAIILYRKSKLSLGHILLNSFAIMFLLIWLVSSIFLRSIFKY